MNTTNLIISENGFEGVNIREVAKRSEVSVGTVYCYFTDKSDLIFSVVEKFWMEALRSLDMNERSSAYYFTQIEMIYNHLFTYLANYRNHMLFQLSNLSAEDKKTGRKKNKNI